MAELKITVDTSIMDRVIRETPGQVDALLDSLAETLKNDIVLSFGTSPSSPGDPPGVDTGTLRASIGWKSEGDRRRVVHDGVEYGVYLEYGTESETGGVKMAPRPFMGPAFERMRVKLADYVRDFGVIKP